MRAFARGQPGGEDVLVRQSFAVKSVSSPSLS